MRGPIPPTVANRNAEPESEPEPEPVAFDRNRSLRNVLLGTGASVVKNGCLRLRKERPDHALKKKILDIFFTGAGAGVVQNVRDSASLVAKRD